MLRYGPSFASFDVLGMLRTGLLGADGFRSRKTEQIRRRMLPSRCGNLCAIISVYKNNNPRAR